MKNIIFVCTGNTCRSPMAEAILKDMLKTRGLKNIKVTSCGVAAYDGEPMADNAKKALKSMGIPVPRHKSTLCDLAKIDKANMVVTMTAAHKTVFAGRKNVYTIGELAATGDISDPYGQSEEVYIKCAEQLKKACEALIEILL